jgi:hypothetical protein
VSIRLLEPAQAELDEAIAWYAAQAPGLGDAFLIETLKAIKLIDQFPTAWHPLTPPHSPMPTQTLSVQRGVYAGWSGCAGLGDCTPTPQAQLLAQQVVLASAPPR